MHTSIFTRAEQALVAIRSAAEVQNFLNRIEIVNDSIDAKLKTLAELVEAQQITNIGSELRQIILTLPKVTLKTNMRQFFLEIESLHRQFSLIFSDAREPSEIVTMLQNVDLLADYYNNYVQSPGAEGASRLLKCGRDTQAALKNLSSFLSYLVANSREAVPVEGESEFSLDIFYTSDLEDFTNRLFAISKIYHELAELLNASVAPLRIAKIESGSLLTKLVGDTKVVDLFVDVMRGAAKFYHRNYTNEGKIAAIAPKVEMVEKVLGLAKKLEDAGVDVEIAKEQLGKSAHEIATQLNALLSDQPTISVNGEKISVGEAMTRSMLENNKTRLIAPSSDASPPASLPPPA